MKRLTTYLNEKLIINKNYNPYTCAPKSFDELRKIIKKRYKEQGPGTEQNPINLNDIDVRNIVSFYDKAEGIYIGLFEEIPFEYIDISGWNVSNVKDMRNIFYMCRKIKSVGDLSNWDVSNAENMYGMFYECKQLESVGDLSNWDVSKVKDMSRMFTQCKELKSVGDLSNWYVTKVRHINAMFWRSGIINIPSWYKL